MYKAPVFKADGEKKSKAQALPGSLFDGVVHEPAMWQAVKAYLANQRLGTAATKTRSQVRGGNRKPWRQKGTGRARQGSIRSPQWRGGGNVFGPRGDQSFREKLPRKLKGLARRSAFNARAEDGKILLVDALSLEGPRTKDIIQLLEGVGAEGNVLLLTDGVKREVYLSARNIPQVQVKVFGQESAYDVLWSDTVVIELSALEALPAGEEPAEEPEAAAPAKKARKSKKAAAPEAEAAVEPTATAEPETQPSDSLAGGPAEEATEAEEAPKKKRASRKKKDEE